MNSSGIKRGLAASAIAALAVTGIPSVASANSYADQLDATEVLLYSQYSGGASVQNDGSNTTVHLLAGGGADVTQIQFQYQGVADLAPVNIGSPVSRADGVFSLEWNAPSSVLNLPGTTIIAQPLRSTGTEIAGAEDTATVNVTGNRPAVDITNARGSAIGVFQQPYGADTDMVDDNETGAHNFDLGVISGVTSAAGDNDRIVLNDLTDGTAKGSTAVNGIIREAAANGLRAFKGSVDFSNYTFDNAAPVVDEAVVGAEVGDAGASSDDAEALDLYTQTITTVTAAAGSAMVPTGAPTTGNVTVLDQNGKAVRGAQVILDRDADGEWEPAGDDANLATTEDNDLELYTNVNGVATAPGLAGSPAGSTYSFIVNTDDGDDFESAKDFRRTITVTSFDQVASAVSAKSADGAAFDVDEHNGDEITVKVADQNGTGMNNQTVTYSWTFTAFPTVATPNPTPVVTNGSTTTGPEGTAVVELPTGFETRSGKYVLNYFVNRDGTPGQQSGDLGGSPLNITAGDAELKFADASAALAGSTSSYSAKLMLADGTVLPGRAVRFSFDANGGDVVMASQANQPTGTTRVSDTAADDVTDSNGAVQVALSDPANTPARSELNGELSASTQNNPIGSADESAGPIDVDFVNGQAPARSTVEIAPMTAMTPGTPGRAESGTVTVLQDADNDPTTDPTPVANLAVTLTVDDGFFTDGTPSPAPVKDADAGELKSLTKNITVVTDADGEATFMHTIEGDDEFNDDGLAEAIVTASIGSANDTEDVDYSSANPLNGGTVSVEYAPASFQQSGVLPKAPTSDNVALDVIVTDQFGNEVEGEDVVISRPGAADETIESDVVPNADIRVGSDEAGDLKVTATWEAATTKYDAVLDEVVGTEKLTDAVDIEFYEVDYAASTFAISNTGDGTQPVGSTVTVTYAATDQNGEEISDLFVRFFRNGPDNQQDGDGNANGVLGQDGRISYTYQGSEAGTARVTAVGVENYDPFLNTGDVVEGSSRTNTVVFGAPAPARTAINAQLTGLSNGAAADRLTVAAESKAAGATVRLFRVVDGRRVLVSRSTLNAAGDKVFTVRDRNGRRFTRYIAVVAQSPDTLADTSRGKSVR